MFNEIFFVQNQQNHYFGPKLLLCPWRCRFRTSAHDIAMTIPRVEVRNSEFHSSFSLFWANKSKRAKKFPKLNFSPRNHNRHGNSMNRSLESAYQSVKTIRKIHAPLRAFTFPSYQKAVFIKVK